MTQTITIAVCICNGVTLADFIAPMEILGAINLVEMPMFPADVKKDVKFRFAIDYVAPTKEPIHALTPGQVTINPTRTYSEVLKEGFQYDIIWIPAGPLPEDFENGIIADAVPKEQIEFIRKQALKAQYVMSVCLGSAQLAAAGILDGKRATTNKYLFKTLTKQTSNKIHWIAKARWVVDGNIWTSSGVSSGSDMALAFLEQVTSKAISEIVRGIVEVSWAKDSEDDPFAAFHKLV